MRFWLSTVISATLATSCVSADTYDCAGSSPDWSLTLAQNTAQFSYIGTTDMTIPQRSRAEGRSWPIAMTLVSEDFSSTAIVVLHDRVCPTPDGALEVQVLTQRQDLPVLLTGCCLPS